MESEEIRKEKKTAYSAYKAQFGELKIFIVKIAGEKQEKICAKKRKKRKKKNEIMNSWKKKEIKYYF